MRFYLRNMALCCNTESWNDFDTTYVFLADSMFVGQENAMQIYRVAVRRHSETIMVEQTAVIPSRQGVGEV
jgi:hypothetical protein